jgi:hypothetical protein
MRKERFMGSDEHDSRTLEERSFDFATAVVRLSVDLASKIPPPILDKVVLLGAEIGREVDAAHATKSKRQGLKHLEAGRIASRDIGYWLRLISATELVAQDDLQPFLVEAKSLNSMLIQACTRKRKEIESHFDK